MKDIDKLKGKIYDKTKEKDLVDIWDILMKEYGYIPYNDFLLMESQIVTDLLEIINSRSKKNESSLDSARSRK